MRSAGRKPTRLPSCVLLLYLDDAGSPGNKSEDDFVLGGICVFEAQVDWFSREVAKLAAPFDAAAPRLKPRVELEAPPA